MMMMNAFMQHSLSVLCHSPSNLDFNFKAVMFFNV